MRVISFDMDGTLVKMDFVDAVWLEEIPRLYAEKNGITFEEAKRKVEEEYLKVGPEAIEWYEIDYWLRKFGIEVGYKKIFERCKNKLALYDDALQSLRKLEGENLIIISNASLEFIEYEMEELGIGKYFSHIFSAVSHFRKTKKDSEVYQNVCRRIGIDCRNLIHVGDNYEFDYLAPRRAGAIAYYLDRHKNENGNNIVWSLNEFVEEIL